MFLVAFLPEKVPACDDQENSSFGLRVPSERAHCELQKKA